MQNQIPKFLLAIAAFIAIHEACIAAEKERPNIVLIMCDDLGYADVGFNGGTEIPTPSLDQLAENGTVFTSAYVAHPFCGPSRMGMLSGRYPHVYGGQFNLPERGPGVEQGIPVHETLISDSLQESGYYTGLIGKWHLGIEPQFHPNVRCFDDFYGFLGGGHCYFPDVYAVEFEKRTRAGIRRSQIWSYLAPLEHNGHDVAETEYLTDALSHEGVRFVQDAAKKDQPFFLFLSYNAPHTPLEAKEEDLKQMAHIADQDRRTYAAMVYAVDRGVGELVEALKAVSEFDNTLIVFLSDNGGRTDKGASNVPLKGAKGDTFEGGYRVPMFFHWPQYVPAKQRFPYVVSALDFFPTFARLGGAAIPAGKQFAGKDIWASVLSGQDTRPGESIYTVRHRSDTNDVGVRRDQWKLHSLGTGGWKLFDINRDVGEEHDLSSQHPDQLTSMINDVRQWTESHVEPKWFDSEDVGKKWRENNMPNFNATFEVRQLPENSASRQ